VDFLDILVRFSPGLWGSTDLRPPLDAGATAREDMRLFAFDHEQQVEILRVVLRLVKVIP